MNTPKRTLFGSLAAAAVLATAFGSQAIAAPSQDDGAASSKVGMLGAMQRDLGLTKTQATDRLASEAKAAKADKTLEKALGADYAGSWYDAKAGTLVVAVTDASQAGTVKAQGAQVRTVERSAAELDGYMKDLDAKQASAPSTVAAGTSTPPRTRSSSPRATPPPPRRSPRRPVSRRPRSRSSARPSSRSRSTRVATPTTSATRAARSASRSTAASSRRATAARRVPRRRAPAARSPAPASPATTTRGCAPRRPSRAR